MPEFDIIDITESNADQESLFCIRNPKNPGFRLKFDWLKKRRQEGLKLKILKVDGEPAGFIEYIPGDKAWRPVNASGYMFIHCLWVYPKKFLQQGIASRLIGACCDEAVACAMQGVAVQVSQGSWMAGREVFQKNSFQIVEKKGRFQLLVKKFKDAPGPTFRDWDAELARYPGLHLVYAPQCPLFIKSVEEMRQTAHSREIELEVTVLDSAAAAQQAPSGYGVYSLVYNGRLLADHYISNTRFCNILNKELPE